MAKKFNITGTCIPQKHYMVDTSQKIEKIINLIENGDYFSISRPRQYGKTTSFFQIFKILQHKNDYMCLKTSFEGLGMESYANAAIFVKHFVGLLAQSFEYQNKTEHIDFIKNNPEPTDLMALDHYLGKLVTLTPHKIVLLIDEVDKSMNNQLFLDFLAMLRNKYLSAVEEADHTFHSVVLAGLHDVKTLKLHLRPDAEQKYNSPWNIAVDFDIDMSFNPQEISTMLVDYCAETNVKIDIVSISERIYFYTSGYPFLVSRICKEIDEKIVPQKAVVAWSIDDVEEAVKRVVRETNTNFDSLAKNLENNPKLFSFTEKLILGSEKFAYTPTEPTIYLAYQHGIINHQNYQVVIHNKIYNEVITNYMVNKFKIESSNNMISSEAVTSRYLDEDSKLLMDKILLTFQKVIQEKYSKSEVFKSDEFLEKDLRLLFLVFLNPIINGIGFSFKEVETGAEKKIDIVVVFEREKFVIELKLWYGESYHQKGITQLKNYLKLEHAQKGYMLIMDKTRHKEFTSYTEDDILMVWI